MLINEFRRKSQPRDRQPEQKIILTTPIKYARITQLLY